MNKKHKKSDSNYLFVVLITGLLFFSNCSPESNSDITLLINDSTLTLNADNCAEIIKNVASGKSNDFERKAIVLIDSMIKNEPEGLFGIKNPNGIVGEYENARAKAQAEKDPTKYKLIQEQIVNLKDALKPKDKIVFDDKEKSLVDSIYSLTSNKFVNSIIKNMYRDENNQLYVKSASGIKILLSDMLLSAKYLKKHPEKADLIPDQFADGSSFRGELLKGKN